MIGFIFLSRTINMNPDYRMVGVAIVAADKPRDSIYIEARPISATAFINGEVSAVEQVQYATGVDGFGQTYEKELDVTQTVAAKWRAVGGSNLLAPPDVVKGERVMLYQIGDSSAIFFWDSYGNDIAIRKLETRVTGITADPNPDNPLTKENSYWSRESSHDKIIERHTSDVNGEAAKYDDVMDLEAGTVSLKDNHGNEDVLDSPAQTRLIKIGNGDYIKLEPNRLTIKVKHIDFIAETWNMKGVGTSEQVYNFQQGFVAEGDNGSGMTCSVGGRLHASKGLSTDKIDVDTHVHDVINHSVTSAPRR